MQSLPSLFERAYISRIPFSDAWPCRPTMMWSWIFTPSGAAIEMISSVIFTSCVDGVGSPEGWLCTRRSL